MNRVICVYDDLIELYGWGKAGFLSHLINQSNYLGGPIQTTYKELAKRIHLTDRRVREYGAEFTRLGLLEITHLNDRIVIRVKKELCEKYRNNPGTNQEARGMKKFQGGVEKISRGGRKNFIPYEAETIEKSSESDDAKINNNKNPGYIYNREPGYIKSEPVRENKPVREEDLKPDTSPVRTSSKPVNVEPVGLVAELTQLVNRIKEKEGGEDYLSALYSLGWRIKDNDFASKYALAEIPRLFGGFKESAKALREYKEMFSERYRASESGEFWRRIKEWGKGYLLQRELQKTLGIDFRTFKSFKEIIAYTKREVPKDLVKRVLIGWYYYTRPGGITLDDVLQKAGEIEKEKESKKVGLAF